MFQRWYLVGWSAAAVSLMVMLILLWQGLNEEAVRLTVRSTAKTSFLIFIFTYISSPLYQLWPNRLSRWLLANRRYLGVSFAASHLIHLLTIFTLAFVTHGQSVGVTPKSTIYGGGFAYLLIIAMTITSFDRTARLISKRSWQLLHTTGTHFIWLIFAVSYLGRATKITFYLPFATLVLSALLLRLGAFLVRLKVKRSSLVTSAKL